MMGVWPESTHSSAWQDVGHAMAVVPPNTATTAGLCAYEEGVLAWLPIVAPPASWLHPFGVPSAILTMHTTTESDRKE